MVLQYHECGDGLVRIGNYTYSKKHLENKPRENIEVTRYNRSTDKWEFYNPSKEGPLRDH